jgi:hypothetical protein
MASTMRAKTSWRRPVIVTVAPSLAKSRAIDAPVPVPLPVTIATLVARFIDVSSESCDEVCWSMDRVSRRGSIVDPRAPTNYQRPLAC